MLKITIPATEMYDEINNAFIITEEVTLQLEHSLISISKWESKWHRSFLSRREKTYEETVDYIKCMTLTPNIDDDTYNRLTRDNVEQINAYIEAPMTATHFFDPGTGGGSKDAVTSELIYSWMISLGIPFECQNWHLNRLLTLVKVCNIKNQPNNRGSRKPSQADISKRNAINAARRKQYNTKG